ncbi:MAG: hypothetical protein D6781_09015 [Verrucomicrobia bacterium]|nr:MAG: hypothetical protein D6781_09015 [Verrucomicrobiota bacterium]
MKHLTILPLCFILGLLASGCAVTNPQITPPMPAVEADEKPALGGSLFPSDQAVLGDEAIARILGSSVTIPAGARIALMRFPDADSSRAYGRYYWADEGYLKVQQGFMDTLENALMASGVVREATPLPSLMTPRNPSLPILREAAVRMQADLLLIYRIRSATYSKYRMFAGDSVKAFSTCEVVLLDVRTGIVPFSKIITREHLEKRQKSDMELAETMRRTEEAAATDALEAAAEELVSFLRARVAREG